MSSASAPLRVVHVFRAPVGGLFRHVMDVARLQAERGCEVGLIADSSTGGARAEQQLAELAPYLSLGILRVPMHRNPHPSDLSALSRIKRHLDVVKPDVLHGHGAKGGLFARLPSVFRSKPYITAYTPHGGSLNYFPGSMAHRAYMLIERFLERGTSLFLFESQFVCDRYREFVGPTSKMVQVFLNGLHSHEFMPVAYDTDAADLMFIGELRYAKGIDLMLDAIAAVKSKTGRALSINIIGSGPDEAALNARADQLGIAATTRFLGAMPARKAFGHGKIMVVPSRFESMPYVVLEAAGCGQPMISTKVGGIPEIFGPDSASLIEAGDKGEIERALMDTLGDGHSRLMDRTARLRDRVMKDFSAEKMTETVISAYRRALARKAGSIALAQQATSAKALDKGTAA